MPLKLYKGLRFDKDRNGSAVLTGSGSESPSGCWNKVVPFEPQEQPWQALASTLTSPHLSHDATGVFGGLERRTQLGVKSPGGLAAWWICMLLKCGIFIRKLTAALWLLRTVYLSSALTFGGQNRRDRTDVLFERHGSLGLLINNMLHARLKGSTLEYLLWREWSRGMCFLTRSFR